MRERQAAIHCCASACRRDTFTSRAAASACAATWAARDSGGRLLPLPLLPLLPLLPPTPTTAAAGVASSLALAAVLLSSRPSRSRTWVMVGVSTWAKGEQEA